MGERDVDERIARLEERLARIEARLGIPRTPPVASPVPEPILAPSAEHVPLAKPVVAPPPLPQTVSPATPQAAKPRAAGAFETQVGLKWAAWVGAIIVVIGAALGIKFAYDQHWFEALPAAARLTLMSLGGFALLAAGEVVYRRIGALASAGLFGAGVATLFVVSYAGHRYFDLYERDAAFALMGLVTLLGAGVAIRANLVSIGVLSVVGGNVAPLVLGEDSRHLVPLLTYLLALQVVSLALAWWGREPKWWTLRGVSLATICLWMLLPISRAGELPAHDVTVAITFTLLYAALFHTELVLSSLRPPNTQGSRRPEFTVPLPLGTRELLEDRRGIGVTFSFFVTAAATVAVLVFVWNNAQIVRGGWTVGLGACCLLLGLMLPRLRREQAATTSDTPSPIPALATGYRIQAAALLIVAIPVTLSGVWVTVAWAVLALAFATAGASLNLGVSRVAAVLVWLLAVGNLGLWTLGAAIGSGTAAPMATWLTALGQPIPAYLVLAALMTVAGHAVAWLIREDWSAASADRQALAAAEAAGQTDLDEVSAAERQSSPGALNLEYERSSHRPPRPLAGVAFRSLGATTDALAVLVFVAAAFAALPPLGVTFALLAYGWVLVGAGQVARSPELQPAGLLLIAAAAGKWLLFDTLQPLATRSSSSMPPPAYRPVYNPAAGIGAALFVSGLALLRVPLGARWQKRSIRAAGGFAAVLVLLWSVTLEINRYFDARAFAVAATSASTGNEATDYAHAAQVVISVFWSAYAIGCVALGFMLRVAGLRYFGLALFALTVFKVVLVDLSTVSTGYRILSFLGLGLLLLGTSVLYGKVSPVLLKDAARSEDRT